MIRSKDIMTNTIQDTKLTTNTDNTSEEKRIKFNKRIVTSLGDKGGTSKSFLVRKIAELHLAANTPKLMLVDGDSTVGSLFKFYGERDSHGNVVEQSARGVQAFGINGEIDARDAFINQLLQRDSNLVLMDLPATSLSRLRQMATDYDLVKVVGEAGYRMTIISPITPYDDSILDLRDAIALIDPTAFATFSRLSAAKASPAEFSAAQKPARVDYLAIVNLGLAEDRNDFTLWDSPDSFTRKLLGFVGGQEIEIPRLRPRIAALLAKHRLTFTNGERTEHIDLADRMRLEKWNLSAEAAMRTSNELLGF
jgi:sigma54-dependent transcription regulator